MYLAGQRFRVRNYCHIFQNGWTLGEEKYRGLFFIMSVFLK